MNIGDTFLANAFLTRVKEKFKAIFRRSSKFKSVEDLILQEKYDEAFSEVEKIENQGQLQENEKIKSKILTSQIYLFQGKFERAMELADSSFQEGKALENQILMIEAKILKADILWDLKKIDESLNTAESAENMLKSLKRTSQNEIDRYTALIHTIKGSIYRRKGDSEQALKYLQNSLDLNKKLKNEIGIAQTLNVLGIISASKGNFDQALELLFESLNTYEKLGIQRGSTFKIYNNLALIYDYKAQPTDALNYYQKALDISEEFGNPEMKATLLLNIGKLNFGLGEFNTALDNFHLALSSFQELNIKPTIAQVMGWMGQLYTTQGEVDKALKLFNENLIIYEELDILPEIGQSYHNMAEAYQKMGNLKEAIKYCIKSQQILQEVGNNLPLANSLQLLVKLLVLNDSKDQAEQYLKKFQEISEKEDNKIINQAFRLSKAFSLKDSDRMVSRAQAQQIFQEISEEEVVNHDLTVEAMLNSCEILLTELRASGDEEVVSELKVLLEKLQKIAKDQNSYFVLVNTQMLSSKVALLDLDLEASKRLLNEAQQLAQEKGLKSLAVTASGEYDILLSQLSQWDDLIDRNVSMLERLELTELEGMVSKVISNKSDILEIPEEKAVMLLILSQSGTRIFSKSFAPESALDEGVVGDLLTAINNFIQETFSATGTIERVKHKEHTLLMKPMDPLLCVYVVKGQTYSAIQKLDKFITAAKSSVDVWKILKESGKSEEKISSTEIVDNLVTDIFSSPHQKSVSQGVGNS